MIVINIKKKTFLYLRIALAKSLFLKYSLPISFIFAAAKNRSSNFSTDNSSSFISSN